MKKTTCVNLIRENKTLLPYQTQKIIGRKGYGGGIKPGESWKKCATREVDEESGGRRNRRINPNQKGGIKILQKNLIPSGLIDFYNGTEAEVPFGDPSFRVLNIICFIFSGKAIPTHEMIDPQWYDIAALPIDEMIKGDELFVPDLLSGKKIKGWIRRTTDLKNIIEYHFEECDSKELVI